jgi:hypothetical protein
MTDLVDSYLDAAVRLAGRRSADEIRTLWRQLAPGAAEPACFEPSQLGHLPEPARRWLTHALSPGTPLAGAVLLRMHGHIRTGRWLPFRAVQLHVPPQGYLWVARAGLGPVSIRGYDSYAGGIGRMRWRLFGRLPVVDSDGPDVDRSAAGRVALDAFVLPSSWLSPEVTWHSGPDADTAVAQWQVDRWSLRVCIEARPDGALRSITMQRWAAPPGQPWGEYSCGGTLDAERRFGTVIVPTALQAGYFFRTPRWPTGEFFRATITDATFL